MDVFTLAGEPAAFYARVSQLDAQLQLLTQRCSRRLTEDEQRDVKGAGPTVASSSYSACTPTWGGCHRDSSAQSNSFSQGVLACVLLGWGNPQGILASGHATCLPSQQGVQGLPVGSGCGPWEVTASAWPLQVSYRSPYFEFTPRLLSSSKPTVY